MTRSRSVIYFNSGAIGEFLMTLHFADAVHAADPETRVVIPVRRNGAMLAELARAYPNTDVISLGKEDLLRGLVRLWNISGVRIVLTQQTFGTHPFLLVALARMTAWRGGLQSRFLAFDDRTLLSRILAPSRWRFDLSSRFPEEMCRLASGLGFASECPQPRLRGVQVLPNAGPAYAVFHLRANIPARTPSMGAWRELILGARATWPEMPFLFSGSAADTDFIDAVIAGIPFCENIAARDTLPVLAGILANAALYVGPDTGITHLAAFVGTPSVVWGTRSTPCWWATYSPTVTWLSEGASCGCDGKKSSACRVEVEGEGKFRCLADVPATAVLATMVEQVRLS